MDNSGGVNNFSGGNSSQASVSSSSHSVKDPLDYLNQNNGNNSEGSGLISRFLFHEQIQSCEVELQYLNSNKSDFGGTSVGMSDAKLRFLGIRSHGIIQISFWSLILSSMLYIGLFLFGDKLAALVIMFICLFHCLFPAYIVYGLGRFVSGEKFTMPYFKKIKNVWRVFEIIYISYIAILLYVSMNLDSIGNLITQYVNTNRIMLKIYLVIAKKTPFELIPSMIEHLIEILLIGIILYVLIVYKRLKESNVVKKNIEFEHKKETLRPAQLARTKCGKMKE